MTDPPPSTALIAAGSPAAPDPMTKISVSRSQLRSLLTAVCSIVFHPLEKFSQVQNRLQPEESKYNTRKNADSQFRLWYRHSAGEQVNFHWMGFGRRAGVRKRTELTSLTQCRLERREGHFSQDWGRNSQL